MPFSQHYLLSRTVELAHHLLTQKWFWSGETPEYGPKEPLHAPTLAKVFSAAS